MVVVFVKALLQHRTEIIPEFGVFVGSVAGFLAELAKYPPHQLLPHPGNHRVRLQHFATDIEREILTVDDAAQEPEIRREQIRALVGNKHPPNIKLDPALALRIEQVEWL